MKIFSYCIFADLDDTNETNNALGEEVKSEPKELRFLDDTLRVDPVDNKVLKELEELAKKSGTRNKIDDMLSKKVKFIANVKVW